MSGWVEVSCEEYDAALDAHPDCHVRSSLTDPDGNYWSPMVFREWWVGEEPLVRYYRSLGQSCQHFVPAADGTTAYLEADDA